MQLAQKTEKEFAPPGHEAIFSVGERELRPRALRESDARKTAR
jgi:hypothetical protein